MGEASRRRERSGEARLMTNAKSHMPHGVQSSKWQRGNDPGEGNAPAEAASAANQDCPKKYLILLRQYGLNTCIIRGGIKKEGNGAIAVMDAPSSPRIRFFEEGGDFYCRLSVSLWSLLFVINN